MEESRLRVRVRDLVLCHEQQFRDRKKPHHEVSLVFHVEPVNPGSLKSLRSQEEHLTFEWLEPAQLSKFNFLPRIMPTVISGWMKHKDNAPRWISN